MNYGSGSRQSGFTLIELLVVIAIIAILAAILFPVFAQARKSARGAASISNIRQTSLGIQMYVQDYDETFPLDQHITNNGPWCLGGPCSGQTLVSVWAYDIQPYIKNYLVYQDPLAGYPLYPNFFTGNIGDFAWSTEGQYGYNHVALSPILASAYNGPTPWARTPATLASISRPAELIMVTGKASLQEEGWWWQGPGTFYSYMTVEPPDCRDVEPACFDGWGIGGWGDFIFSHGVPITAEAGRYTGTVSFRKGNFGTFALADGHTKFMNAAQAAVGTNWNPNIQASDLHITDPTKYMWATQP
jgi:prepilin-type N-terminal cleavage/methylation domain-containing protein